VPSESRDWQNWISDMLEAIAEVREFTDGLTFAQFQADRRTIKAVLYSLAIIGEAAGKLPADLISRYPEVPWNGVRAMRNIVVHEYFQVNLEIIWQTVQTELLLLEAVLQQMNAD